jgi:hypothetical protein
MPEQVHRVLFVSSLYESFILAEDGHLHERVLGEFLESSLRQPPDLMRVSAGREALHVLRRGQPRVDLVVTSPHVGDMDARALAAEMAAEGIDIPVVVLGFSDREIRDLTPSKEAGGVQGTFLWQGDGRILLAIVKSIEDRLNAEHDTRAGVPVFLVVEDSVRYYSSFLPVIYSEVLNLSQAVLAEAGNRLQRYLRMRARPKILLSTTFEDAFEDFTRYQDLVMGVIADIEFPRGGSVSSTAGIDLTAAIRELQPDVPLVLQSSHPGNRDLAASVGASFLLKGAPDFLLQLRRTLTEHLFFGDFVFRDAEGDELARASDLKGLVETLRSIPEASLAYHAARNDFSRWLRARAEFGLASTLRPRRLEDFPTVEHLRTELVRSIDRYRRERNRGTAAPFRPDLFDGEEGIVQIGGGSLGGKGRGLAFASRLLDEVRLADHFPGIRVEVPSAVVLGTGVFERFFEDTEMRELALQSEDEAETRARILATPLPADVREALARVVAVVDHPLAVRSSSLLEDSPRHSFAGVYRTWLLPNDAPDPRVRRLQLEDAIKRVYASTFSRRARAFLDATSYRVEEEAMAVVIQRLIGGRFGGRFYPHVSGVARSHNYYPTPPARTEDGVCAVALGLGKTVAEGEPCLRFAPPFPEHVVELSSLEGTLESTQRGLWALQLGEPPPPGGWVEDGPLVRLPLRAAEEDGTLEVVASTYSAENDVVYDGLSRPGTRLVTFAPILKHGRFPLTGLVRELLIVGMAGTRLPVEIEFAIDLAPADGGLPEVGFLQLRPISASVETDVELPDAPPARVLCESPSVLGHGRVTGLRDLIVVDRSAFERSRSGACAEDVAWFNALLAREKRPYALLGVGRWGSTQPWLGIPVRWEDISGARVIVEAQLRDLRVAPSQGTHFFQNLVSLNVGYFTVNAAAGEGRIDWDWLLALTPHDQKGVVRHLRLDEPIEVLMDGRRRRGVILKPPTAGSPLPGP